MLHACVQKFDVIENLEKIWELNRALPHSAEQQRRIGIGVGKSFL